MDDPNALISEQVAQNDQKAKLLLGRWSEPNTRSRFSSLPTFIYLARREQKGLKED
jgi:hypothetical protein